MVDRLSSEDQVMLWPEARWPQHVAALLVLEPGPLTDGEGALGLDEVRTFVAGRLARSPRFRQRLVVPPAGLGGPFWVDDPAFDIGRHIAAVGIPPPGGDDALLAVVEQLRRRPLEGGKPLWDMCLLTGLAGGRIGLYARMHHVIADGIAGVATLGVFLDPGPTGVAGPVAGRAWRPRPAPSSGALAADVIRRRWARGTELGRAALRHDPSAGRHASATPQLRRLLTGPHPPRTSLDRKVGPDRTMALVRTDLACVRDAARAHGATVNDVLLTVTAGGLRALFDARGEASPRLPAYVPVTLRPPEEREHARGNRIAQMVVPLPLDIADPVRRLQDVARLSATRKAAGHPPLSALLGTRLGRALLVALLQRNPVSVTTADLVGPSEARWFAGARVLEVVPVLPLIGSVTLGVAALSYAGQLAVMAVADADACPDLPAFAQGLRADLATLTALAAQPCLARG